MKDIRVLVTSISKKVPLLKKVREALSFFGKKSHLFGADSDKDCIGQYFVDEFWQIPFLDKLTKEIVLDYCKKNKINAIIPTRNEELTFWSEIQDFLFKNNVHVMVSERQALETVLDKELFYKSLILNSLKTPSTVRNISQLDAKTFVVKEKNGAGSRGIGIKLTKQEALNHAKKLDHPIFQPFVEGPEYSIDLFIEKNGSIKGAIARERLLVVDGESQISKTVSNKPLENLCKKAALKLRLRGHVIFQVIESKQDKSYYLIECNPRFGGASTLSIQAGLESFRWFFHEVLNEPLPEFKRAKKEIKLIRHAEDSFSP